MWQVFEKDRPCSSYGFKTWEADTFVTIEEAVGFAYHWSTPGYTSSQAA